MPVSFSSVDTPFGPAVPAVHLPEAPLGLVIAQVRFPTILSIDLGGTLVAAFQERIRSAYPLSDQNMEAGLVLGQQGLETSRAAVWRFRGRETQWQVSLTRSFIALSTPSYTHRDDFHARLRELVEALSETVAPNLCDRIGVRYTSKLENPELLGRLQSLVRPEVLGTLQDNIGVGAKREHTITDALYTLADAALRARWGLIPAGATLDPTIAPSENQSFVIDIDVVSIDTCNFDSGEILGRVSSFCDYQYRFFRWMVTDEYLRAHGGRSK